jgi:predicted secreted hydrolase
VLTEWWYYHGHLQAEGGGEYGFQLVVFKRRGPGGRAGYVAHAAVTDHERRAFQFQQELSLPPPAMPPTAGFDLAVGSQHARGNAGSDELRGRTADYGFTLHLNPLKPPVLHGVTGYIGVSPGELSYYYTRPRLAVSGTLTAHGRPHAVTGLAWMDHQWGDFSLEGPGGWDWAGVQLSDGSDLMVSVLRDGGGRTVLAYGTLVSAQGEARHLAGDALRLTATGRWTSPATGISYPSGWELEVPGAGARLALRPVLPEQELDTRDTTGRVYWEGQVRVQGATATGPVTGRGYVELTGYAPGQR